METMAQVKTNLKTLRLRSFIDNLELRNKEAINCKMSYIDFLLTLSQDEIDNRRFRKKERTPHSIYKCNRIIVEYFKRCKII
jgi:hypothetical protein